MRTQMRRSSSHPIIVWCNASGMACQCSHPTCCAWLIGILTVCVPGGHEADVTTDIQVTFFYSCCVPSGPRPFYLVGFSLFFWNLEGSNSYSRFPLLLVFSYRASIKCVHSEHLKCLAGWLFVHPCAVPSAFIFRGLCRGMQSWTCAHQTARPHTCSPITWQQPFYVLL